MDEGVQEIKQEVEPGQKDIQPLSIPPLVDSGPIEAERDTGTTSLDKATDGKGNLGMGSACRDVEKTHGEDAEDD